MYFHFKFEPLKLLVYNSSYTKSKIKENPWSESANELYRPKDRRLTAKSVPIFVDRGFLVASVTDPYGSILSFLERSRYFSIK
jgi:hypothetical protein